MRFKSIAAATLLAFSLISGCKKPNPNYLQRPVERDSTSQFDGGDGGGTRGRMQFDGKLPLTDAGPQRGDAKPAQDGPPAGRSDAEGYDTGTGDMSTESDGGSDARPGRTSAHIVYSKIVGDLRKLFVYADGRETQLTFGEGHDYHPTWCVTPTAVYVVYEHFVPPIRPSIRVFNMADPSSISAFTGDPDEGEPQCAPSGWVYFRSGTFIKAKQVGTDDAPLLVYGGSVQKHYPYPKFDESELLFAFDIPPEVVRIVLSGRVATGMPETFDLGLGEHGNPSFAPDGNGFVFTTTGLGGVNLEFRSLIAGTLAVITSEGVNVSPRYSRSALDAGSILFQSDDTATGPFNLFRYSTAGVEDLGVEGSEPEEIEF